MSNANARAASHVVSGVPLLHVPYKGDQLTIIDLLGGRLHLMFQPAVVVKPQIDAGKMKAIECA